MKLSDFKYKINEKLIAQYPLEKRDESRLMTVNKEDNSIKIEFFKDILNYMNAGDCLVVNETKVFPARLKGIKEKTDAEVEIFLLRELENNLWEVLVKPARKVRIGNKLIVNEGVTCDVIDNTVSGGRVVRFNYEGNFLELIDKIGKSPLPPYIKRDPMPEDKEWYQTIFAEVKGAVAAPTAGLHFSEKIVKEVMKKKIKIVPILLHVGLGTFRPVVVEDLTRHRMDSEYFEVSEKSAEIINETKNEGHNVIAIGTTVVRALESAVSSDGSIKAVHGWTDKFIYPPYDFKTTDMMITNFHQSCSTLLMLVAAFASRDLIFKAYRKAMKEKFRFLSYGDAMLIV